MNENYLAHHGIKGQKWGIRRYQNEDGTLTPEGKRRYGGDYESDFLKKKNDLEYRAKDLRKQKRKATAHAVVKSLDLRSSQKEARKEARKEAKDAKRSWENAITDYNIATIERQAAIDIKRLELMRHKSVFSDSDLYQKAATFMIDHNGSKDNAMAFAKELQKQEQFDQLMYTLFSIPYSSGNNKKNRG